MPEPELNPFQAYAEGNPYVSLGILGHGSYGVVDRVEKRGSPGTLFARKTIRITGRNREFYLKTAENEAKILRRLKHRHIVSIVELYQYRNQLSIIMLQVAEFNLEQYLEYTDSQEAGKKRDALRIPMQMWPGCLIQVIDYLHEMRVKHKDLKPANILVMGSHVLLADFGISKDLIDEETTATKNEGPGGTPTYSAPEAKIESRRGRAVDIYSLGCVFLEIATCMIAPAGSLKVFSQYRETGSSRAYSDCQMKLAQWIWFLWGHWDIYDDLKKRRAVAYRYDDFLEHGPAVCDLAFLMLDPNPKTRITSRQIVALVHSPDLYYRGNIKGRACEECGSRKLVKQANLPLHSVYKKTGDLDHPYPPEVALSSNFIEADWEGVKRLWLHEHMWWD